MVLTTLLLHIKELTWNEFIPLQTQISTSPEKNCCGHSPDIHGVPRRKNGIQWQQRGSRLAGFHPVPLTSMTSLQGKPLTAFSEDWGEEWKIRKEVSARVPRCA
jgi:hypothetical protein